MSPNYLTGCEEEAAGTNTDGRSITCDEIAVDVVTEEEVEPGEIVSFDTPPSDGQCYHQLYGIRSSDGSGHGQQTRRENGSIDRSGVIHHKCVIHDKDKLRPLLLKEQSQSRCTDIVKRTACVPKCSLICKSSLQIHNNPQRQTNIIARLEGSPCIQKFPAACDCNGIALGRHQRHGQYSVRKLSLDRIGEVRKYGKRHSHQHHTSTGSKKQGGLGGNELPLQHILKSQKYLPPDKSLLALPLLRLPQHVKQPKYYQCQNFSYKLYPKYSHYMPKKCEFVADKKTVGKISENKLSIGSPLNKQKLNVGQFLVRGKEQNTVESDKTNVTLTTLNANLREKEVIKMDGIEVLREIGRGTYGTVWLVRKRSDQKYLVLKSVDLSHSNQQEAEAARQEVRLLASLKHPNIVSYKGSFELSYQLHLLMGYCEGGDLFTCIKQQHGKLFSEQRVIRWFIQITMALQYLHGHNILHRDLKTQNIFLTRSGLIKLGDFGIARILGSSIDMATTMIGTPYYMSPELFAGLPYNYKSDIWALGCCLYELVTLKHAFHARDMSGLIYKISHGKIGGISKVYSEDLQCLISDMLNRTSDVRPSTSQILHRPFVKGHISAFLKDTKQPVQSDEVRKVAEEDCNMQINPRKENTSLNETGRIVGCMYLAGKLNEEKMKEEVIRPNLGARRCCEIFPEFESLQISGDKMKLESRSKVESKPSGVKECQCKRQGNKEMPSAGQGSKSRRRRHHNKNSVIPDSSTNQETLDVAGDSFLPDISSAVTAECSPSASSAFSARERRRQRRLQEKDLDIACEEMKMNSSRSTENIFDCEYVTEKEVKAKASIDACITGDTVSEAGLDNPLIQGVPVSLKFQEVTDFVNILDTTLSDDGVENFSENCVQDPQITMPKDGLESRIGILEDALKNKVGKGQAAEVISLVKTNSWEGWEDQRALAEKILGDPLFSSVATIVWHLKLCYCFHNDELDHPV